MVVFAAASLKNALAEIATAGKKATISYVASCGLAKQIEQGRSGDPESTPSGLERRAGSPKQKKGN